MGIQGGFEYLGKRYRRLPFSIVHAMDKNDKAVKTYNENFKHDAVCEDIARQVHSDLPDADVVIGGFPCQSFSTVNPTKNPFDERGQLYKHMARILSVKRPKLFVAENVKGMLYLQKGELYKRIEAEFASKGYRVRHKLLNAADYGVPQRRERVFMVGVRNDVGTDFEYPLPTHSADGANGLRRWVGVGDVIDSLIPENEKYYFSERAVQGMKRAKNNMKRGLWQNLGEPCLTITAHLAKVSINSRDPVLLVDPEREVYRRFTPREAARIQSFPDSFVFPGSEGDAYRQVGEAIPPVLAWHMGKAVVQTLKRCEEF